MTSFEWATIALGVIASIGVPMLVMLIRLTVRFTQMSDRIEGLAEDMREDRALNNRRLRWLEETLWKGRR